MPPLTHFPGRLVVDRTKLLRWKPILTKFLDWRLWAARALWPLF
jgi:hypothetical protein